MKRVGFYVVNFSILIMVSLTFIEVSARILFRDSSYDVHPLAEFQHDSSLGWKDISAWGASEEFRVLEMLRYLLSWNRSTQSS